MLDLGALEKEAEIIKEFEFLRSNILTLISIEKSLTVLMRKKKMIWTRMKTTKVMVKKMGTMMMTMM